MTNENILAFPASTIVDKLVPKEVSLCRESAKEDSYGKAIQSTNGIEWRGKEDQEGDCGTEKRTG